MVTAPLEARSLLDLPHFFLDALRMRAFYSLRRLSSSTQQDAVCFAIVASRCCRCACARRFLMTVKGAIENAGLSHESEIMSSNFAAENIRKISSEVDLAENCWSV